MPDKLDDFSRAFYPFLHPDDRKPADLIGDLMKDLRFSLMEKVRESAEVKTRFFEVNHDAILNASLAIARAYHENHKMLVCGNGGSATDAQHVAVEFMHPITVGRKALSAICLSNDMAMVTAVANDESFRDVFTRQVIALGCKGDILLGISTSGNSENIISAFEAARRMGIVTIGYAGGEGGRMRELHERGGLDFCLTVPTSSIHRIQESHVTLYHTMWDLVHTFLQTPAFLQATQQRREK